MVKRLFIYVLCCFFTYLGVLQHRYCYTVQNDCKETILLRCIALILFICVCVCVQFVFVFICIVYKRCKSIM